VAKVPAFTKAFAGLWHIIKMGSLGRGLLDLIQEESEIQRAAECRTPVGALTGFVNVR